MLFSIAKRESHQVNGINQEVFTGIVGQLPVMASCQPDAAGMRKRWEPEGDIRSGLAV
jgi:hypothetical protein